MVGVDIFLLPEEDESGRVARPGPLLLAGQGHVVAGGDDHGAGGGAGGGGGDGNGTAAAAEEEEERKSEKWARRSPHDGTTMYRETTCVGVCVRVSRPPKNVSSSPPTILDRNLSVCLLSTPTPKTQ